MPVRLPQPHLSQRIVFVDTSAIAAVMNENDQSHKKALHVYTYLVENNYSLVLTNFIVAETHALLINTTRNNALGIRWLRDVAFIDFIVVRPGLAEEHAAIQLLRVHEDKLWSMVDAISFIIMDKFSIPYYFSFDEDFRQVGRFLDVTRYVG
jgi:predicted nucleic acid-binding protein